MANYCAKTRSNYFKVVDSTALKDLIDNAVSSDAEVQLWEKKAENGTLYYAFGCDGTIYGIDVSDNLEDPEYDYDEFIRRLQKLLPEDDAIIITSIGSEKLRYLCGNIDVITCDAIKHRNIDAIGREIAKCLLDNPDWDTCNSY